VKGDADKNLEYALKLYERLVEMGAHPLLETSIRILQQRRER